MTLTLPIFKLLSEDINKRISSKTQNKGHKKTVGDLVYPMNIEKILSDQKY